MDFSVLSAKDPEKERQKEEQFRIQQEILARRRDPDAMKQYFEEREFVRVRSDADFPSGTARPLQASSQEAAKATIEPQRRGESNEEWKKRADEWGKAWKELCEEGGLELPVVTVETRQARTGRKSLRVLMSTTRRRTPRAASLSPWRRSA
eukprot:scaffold2069_cov254-Pinguiococcus_pyrenoidosus.AAC.28